MCESFPETTKRVKYVAHLKTHFVEWSESTYTLQVLSLNQYSLSFVFFIRVKNNKSEKGAIDQLSS